MESEGQVKRIDENLKPASWYVLSIETFQLARPSIEQLIAKAKEEGRQWICLLCVLTDQQSRRLAMQRRVEILPGVFGRRYLDPPGGMSRPDEFSLIVQISKMEGFIQDMDKLAAGMTEAEDWRDRV